MQTPLQPTPICFGRKFPQYSKVHILLINRELLNMDKKNTLGVVLAGGISSRMGSDKALLPFHGVRLVDHMVALLENTGVSEVTVSGNVANHSCIKDVIPHCGPIGGVYAVLKSFATHSGSFIFVPVDMPLLTPDLLNQLLRNEQTSNVTYFQEHPLPFVLNNPAIAREILAEQFDRSGTGGSVKAFLKSLNANALPVVKSASANFANLNTPEDIKMSLS